jgi:RNA polymerase sigma factor (sigma-70 family)
MGIRLNATAAEGIQTLLDWGTIRGWPDDRLIDQLRCAQGGGEAAFRALIHRHGPMVMGICRRVLGDEHAAEDAFQATFLVLLKKAATLRDGNLLSNWLHGVALRTATKEKVKAARRRVVERQAAGEARGEPDRLDRSELCTVIDEEIGRLPERYRAPLVLYYMEGLRLDVVASRLGCPVGTVRSRLSRARDRLQSRLARRGLAPTASALGGLARLPGTSDLPRPLVEGTVQAGLRAAAGRAPAWSSLKPRLSRATRLRAGGIAAVLLIGAGIAALAWRVDRTAGGPGTPGATAGQRGRPVSHYQNIAPSTRAVPGPRDKGSGPPAPSRSASAVASPLARIGGASRNGTENGNRPTAEAAAATRARLRARYGRPRGVRVTDLGATGHPPLPRGERDEQSDEDQRRGGPLDDSSCLPVLKPVEDNSKRHDQAQDPNRP